jgi:GMP synthase (glutamine-hydrolysing)
LVADGAFMNARARRITGTAVLAAASFLAGFLVARCLLTSGAFELRGLLIDVELTGPNPTEYKDLRDALEKELRVRAPSGEPLRVSLDYVHFTQFTAGVYKAFRPDFVVLSPQTTPWQTYPLKVPEHFSRAKELVRRISEEEGIPVLGVCGGHQFLALAFGGEVGLIDPAFSGRALDKYPKEAVKEKGVVELQTLMDDPILEGVAVHPGVFRVSESHYEEVKGAPAPMVNIAGSALSPTQLIRLPGRPVYGFAFHPERGWGKDGPPLVETHGGRLLINFLAMAAKHRIRS